MSGDPILDEYPRDLLGLDDLDDVLSWDEQPEEMRAARVEAGHVAPAWHVDSPGKATWALRKLAAAEAELAGVRKLADRERARISAYVEEASREPARFAEFLGNELGRYGVDERERTGKATTVLPTGKISTRQTPAKIEVEDEDSAIVSLEAIGFDDGIRRKSPEVAKDPIKSALVDPVDDLGWLVVDFASGRIVEDVRSVTLEGGEDEEPTEAIVDRNGETVSARGWERVGPFDVILAADSDPPSRWRIEGLRRTAGGISATVSPSSIDVE